MRSAERLILSCGAGMALALNGCTLGVAIRPATPTAAPLPVALTVIPTFSAVPPSLPASAPESPPTQPPPASPGALYVYVSADNVNLRRRPGTVFPVVRLLAKGSRLQLLGHAPGNEWLYVMTDSGINGWILSWLVKGGHDGGPTPLVEPDDVVVVRGRVVDRAGVPISGVGFAVTQGMGPDAPRTDANTDESGQFYAFLPANATGAWLVSYVAIACTSNTMDSNCNCIGRCGAADPQSVVITVRPEAMLNFVWK